MRSIRVLYVLIVLFLVCSTANAKMMTYEFSGTITEVISYYPDETHSFTDYSFSGYFTYDSALQDGTYIDLFGSPDYDESISGYFDWFSGGYFDIEISNGLPTNITIYDDLWDGVFFISEDDVYGFWGVGGGIEEEYFGTVDSFKPIPEPATMILFGTGIMGLAGYRRKNKLR